ncbi:MFS transporter [Kitasatospora brasiliensis]|uniref:MFS transporter n=1 Tax=Kitasatospora brasiliensis TaxID=3058040 RepID=UPI00292DEBEF|nr:MFS transporter [Kitasatospora sp. K002]
MTTTTDSATASSGRDRPPLVTRPLLLRFVSLLGSAIGFNLLLSAVPLYAQESGGEHAAGLATGALMLATVIGELATPSLTARFGYRPVLAAGLVLLGAPTLVLVWTGGMAAVLAVCLLRGLGFAVALVAGGALTAALIPAERRGEGLALIGVVAGVPALFGLPLGVWLSQHVGWSWVFAIGAAAPLAAVASVPALPDRTRAAGPTVGLRQGLRSGALLRPALAFAATALAAGIMVTFLPLAVPSAAVVAVALVVQPAATVLTRWLAGRYGDRRGPAGLVLPALLAAVAGVLLLASTGSAVAVVAGAAVFGAGFGVAQNATLALMYTRVPPAGYGTVTALWNVAYDGGMGIGAVAFGAVASRTGYPWAFVLTAVVMLAALAPAWRDRRGGRGSGG